MASRSDGIRSSPRRTLIAIAAVLIGVPLVLFAWIGGVLLADRLGIPMSSSQVFAWLVAALVGLVVWPLALRAAPREFWRRTHSSAQPPPAPTRGDAAVRVVVAIVGAGGLIALCGPVDTVAGVATAWGALALGPRESGLLIQFFGMLLVVILWLPVFLATRGARRRLAPDDPRRPLLDERESWYAAAMTAWVASLGIGMAVAIVAVLTL